MNIYSNDTFAGTFVLTKGSGTTIDENGSSSWQFTADATGAIDVQIYFTTVWGQPGQEALEVITGTPGCPTSNVTTSRSWNAVTGCQMRGLPSAPSFIITYCDTSDKRDMCLGDGTCPLWPKPTPPVAVLE